MKCVKFMIPILAIAVVAVPLTAAFGASPQARSSAQDAKPATTPINDMCPVGKEPIVATAGTIEYKGKTLGFCCPSCAKEFTAWTEADKDKFVALAMIGEEPGQEEHGKKAADATTGADDEKSDLYTLDTCPITGKDLGSMGDAVIKMIDGREVRFCCKGCVAPFEKDREKYFKEIDKKLIEQQMPYYPTTKCVVTGEPLFDDGEDIAINHIYKNRLVRFCCKMCVRTFNESPQKYLDMLDKLVIEHQREHYPLETCAVMKDSKLGGMGEPVEKIYGNRLVKFCCEGCIEPFEDSPAQYIARLDEAWKALHERHPDVKPGAGNDDSDSTNSEHPH